MLTSFARSEHVAVRDTFIRPISERIIAVDYDSPVTYGRVEHLQHELFAAGVFALGVVAAAVGFTIFARLKQQQ